MTAAAPVRVERRFARSARIDTDLGSVNALEGYVLQPSVGQAFAAMAQSVEQRRQGAFSWTGPYGGGKSSAALLLGAALGPAGLARAKAEMVLGAPATQQLAGAFKRGRKGWAVVGLSGRRAAVADDLRTALKLPGGDLLGALIERVKAPGSDGLLLMIDELGKYLEHAAQDGGDLHVLQDVAELAARSNGRLVVLVILHQSFERYAAKLPRAMRDEWAKIQGRFQDIPLATAGDETLELISRAITADTVPAAAGALAGRIAGEVRQRRGSAPAALDQMLEGCWPLHPVVALLLGPLSRHRFGQNERSVFSFLGSAEPAGFQDHLAHGDGGLYAPAQLFDYLSANLGPAILASSEGHRFSTSLDAIDRAAARGGLLHIGLAKTATLIEMFGAGSGLVASTTVLAASVDGATEREVAAALDELVNWSVLVHRKHLGTYAVFAGSDFDLDAAVAAAGRTDERIDLSDRLALPPVVAKRHYHRTGCLRWSEVLIYPLPVLETAGAAVDAKVFAATHAAAFDGWRRSRPSTAAIVLAVRPSETIDKDAEAAVKAIARRGHDTSVACGLPRSSYLIRELAIELDSLERVSQQNPQLEGDGIARREVQARIAEVSAMLEQEIRGAFVQAKWYAAGRRANDYDGRPLSAIASAEADQLYSDGALIRNELINRDRPSSNAMAAVRTLLHAMSARAREERLGFVGYPPEYALYASILREAGLHRQTEDGEWGFADPDGSEVGRSYAAMWREAAALTDGSTLADLFARWRAAPIGLRSGPMPILALAWLLANAHTIAVYLDGLFTPVIDDLVADRLLQSPEAITIRHVALGREQDALLNGLGDILRPHGLREAATPLTIAQALVRVVIGLPKWAQRTRAFSVEARRVRDLILHAADPNKLLFDELAHLASTPVACVEAVRDALEQLEGGYPAMLEQLAGSLALALGCDPATFEGSARRVVTAIGVTGDLRLDAFAQRVAALEQAEDRRGAIEGLSSFLIHTPAAQWSDQEVDKAHAELIRFARNLREAEALAVARGRAAGAEAVSVMLASRGGEPVVHSFEVSADEALDARAMADRLLSTLGRGNERVQLAALAEALRRIEAASLHHEEAA